jgi:DNA replication and repair protein RecF
MWLRTLTLRSFRNLDDGELDFCDGVNHIFGPNAAGKTSLLEAINYLAIGRSFRPALDRELVRFGSDRFALHGAAVTSRSEARTGDIRSDGQTKKMLLDGVELERLSGYLGWLPVVTLLLDDVHIVRGGPGERRGFLDLALAKCARVYLAALAEYRRVLVRRNRVLLRTGNEALLRTWDEQLANAGIAVYDLRGRFVPGLLATARAQAAELLAEPEIEFQYRATVNQDGDVRANFLNALTGLRGREQALGATLVGPHRDDIIMRKTGRELRRFGSEGEQRCAGIALKLAEAALLRQERGEAPVFLLDEVAAELDASRSRQLLAQLEPQGQLFYATTRELPIPGRRFNVQAGKITTA